MKNFKKQIKEHLNGVKEHLEEAREHLEEKVNSVSKYFEENFSEGEAKSVDFVPGADFYESEEEYFIDVELPGVHREAISLNIEKEMIVISGERSFSKSVMKVLIDERIYGYFYRQFPIPIMADKEKIKAEFKEGVLTIKISKKPIVIEPVVKITIE